MSIMFSTHEWTFLCKIFHALLMNSPTDPYRTKAFSKPWYPPFVHQTFTTEPWLWGQGFLLRILWCSQSVDHSQNKFSQIWLHTPYESRKKKLKTESFYILGLHTGTYHKIWQFEKNIKYKFKIWWIWAIFSMRNPMHRLISYFLGQNLVRFCQ
jgi:hypothetical protein